MIIAYNKFLTYAEDGKPQYVASNLSDYDIHPWHTGDFYRLKDIEKEYNITFPYRRTKDEPIELATLCERFRSQSFEVFLDHQIGEKKIVTVDEIAGKGVNYIYPIILYNNDLFQKYNTINFDLRIIDDAINGRCKICFIQPTEGFFGMSIQNYKWMDDLSLKHGLSPNSLYVLTTNFMANKNKCELEDSGYITRNSFRIIEYSYFSSNVWFHIGGYVTDPYFGESARKLIAEQLTKTLTEKKTKHFLNFNRVPKLHRILLYGLFNSHPLLINKAITTLGAHQNNQVDGFFAFVQNDVSETFKYKKLLEEFYAKHDSSKHAWYDEPDLHDNKAANLNIEAHNECFVNIVSESLIHPTTTFYSEKTFKPIFLCQPFIIVGNPHSLKYLKEQGYQTFSKWWDESYDKETDFYGRFNKILKLIEEIATWDMDKCYKITQEMLPVLIHNFNILLEGNSIKNLLKELDQPQTKPPIRNLI